MIKRDQTAAKYWDIIKDYKNPAQGIGIIAMINEESGVVIKEIIPDVFYRDIIDRKDLVALKFIPYGVMVKVATREFRMDNYGDFENAMRGWEPKCVGKCNEQGDCSHLSDICLCVKGNECH